MSWRSRKLFVVAQSSKYAEFGAMAFCAREDMKVMKFKTLFWRVVEKSEEERMVKTRIGKDDMECLRDVHSPFVSRLSKHVAIERQFMVDHVLKGNVDEYIVPTDCMMPDMMTMNVKRIEFDETMIVMNMR